MKAREREHKNVECEGERLRRESDQNVIWPDYRATGLFSKTNKKQRKTNIDQEDSNTPSHLKIVA